MLTTPPPADAELLERNLRALGPASARAAARVRGAPATPVSFERASDGGLTGVLAGRRLASRVRPIEEGRRHAAGVPLERAGGVVALGFGVGHHLAALAERLRRTGVMFIFEPDLALLRAVLERVDCTPWLVRTNACLLTEPDDSGAIGEAVSGVEGLLALGVKFLAHPPSRARLGDAADRFSARVAEVMRAVRTTVLTTLVHVDVTMRNELGNALPYARARGVAEIAGAHKGKPAVIVAAGPSLHRNIDELCRPGAREGVVVVAVQTVLKALLSRGIRPDYVTSLDYAEVSARFYEGLSARDVEGIELVVEPKAHPAVLRSWAGVFRCPSSRILDNILGHELTGAKGSIRAGATVAHLAYYLARHVGCDPVILVGQDLGFTDGQYYHAGAAIHQVWSGELNDFNTLEMLEWQRIVRSRSMLHRRTDVLGRPIYTDEQMTTYLAQFERDFLADASAGLTVIDATEGGVAKRHTRVTTLHEALGAAGRGTRCDPRPAAAPDTPAPPLMPESAMRSRLRARLTETRGDIWAVGECSRKAATVLRDMQDALGDTARVNALIDEVYRLRDRAESHRLGYDLVQHLNQTGTLNRLKADRALDLDPTLSASERQKRQIERDITNVTWLAEAADEMGTMIDDAVRVLDGRAHARAAPRAPAPSGNAGVAGTPRARVWAIVHADARMSGLGGPRDLGAAIIAERTALDLTLSRLGSCRELDGILVVGDDEQALRRWAGARPKGAPSPRLEFVGADLAGAAPRARAVAAARLMARHCWRAGVAGMSVFDEACDPALVAPLLDRFGVDAAAIVGADWSLVHPALTDALVARHRENPAANQVTFSQAPPGLAPCVITARALRELAASRDRAGPFGTIGALLGYIPVAPQADPIGKPVCVPIAPAVRDLGLRCIPDAPFEKDRLLPVLDRIAQDHHRAPAEEIARALAGACDRERAEIIRLEIAAGGARGGERVFWRPSRDDGGFMPTDLAADAIARFADPHAVLSLEGCGDPLSHPAWRDILRAALDAGFGAVHVRTDLAGPPEDARDLAALAPPLVSVDLLAHSAPTYALITGRDEFAAVRANVEHLLSARGSAGGLPATWIVPRMTRCDAVYHELEAFYDHWLMQAGAAAIDPLPAPMPGQRIAPLPPPAHVLRRDAARSVVVRCAAQTEGAPGPALEAMA